ncbi:alpha/beta-hydrolase [Tothia fuscella]|uniref:Carboxylic ester hydrolase n=1 Tax=Tothia fuscella TaxID=1048955 RepID=A0A9P4U2E5_9PEZI|nr:alpha/beta-hydrolase [Tothia fuscella]
MRVPFTLYLVGLSLQYLFVEGVPASRSRKDDGDDEDWIVGQPVKTSSGILIGQPAKIAPDVSEYLGVPYAQPPIGNLRFAAPKKFEGTGNITARAYVKFSDCPSSGFDIGSFTAGLTPEQVADLLARLNLPVAFNLLSAYGQLGNQFSEDCLTLNIWTKPQTGEEKKAVLVFIYGGGFESGATNNPFYYGQAFANKQDVVLVTLNYRTNVFGFPGIPGLEDVAQNPGLLDQRLAIEWVRDNIEAFGGDKSRITIFGQSAGGASVDLYSFAYKDDPIVNAMIAQSGTATAFFDPAPPDNLASFYNASAKLGCGNSTAGAAAAVACVRTKNTTDLLAATRVTDALASVLGSFGPTSDGKVVFSDYDKRGDKGDFIKKPLLVGNNDYEAGLFRLYALAAGRNFTDLEYCLFNADIFTCPAARAAEYRTSNNVDVYRYRYYGEFYNLRLTSNPSSGTWHGGELPILFQQTAYSGVADTAEETSISNYLQKAWSDFAKDPKSFKKAPYNFPTYNSLGRRMPFNSPLKFP